MDSLLANYASSDDEEPSPVQRRIVPARTVNSVSEAGKDGDFLANPTSKHGGIFNSLPPPKSSLFNSLPPPKPQSGFAKKRDFDEQIVEKSKPKPSSSSSLFTSLPPPKPSSSSSKKVVQFRPPTVTNPNSGKFDNEDEDADEGELERQRKRAKESISTASPASFLSSIPAPRHTATLGTMSSASGTNRRSIIETEAPSSNANKIGTTKNDTDTILNNSNTKYLKEEDPTNEITNDGAVDYTAGSSYDYSYGDGQYVDYTNSGGSYGNYGDHGQYENNWANSIPLPEVSAVAEEALRVPGRRGRKDTPLQIIEVKQDELMKNRPRQDQVKSTGIAFGPQYEPTSTKGKPTKLHKRKHQIGSLLFDMRQKETELAERRSKGFLTKAQTQAKYGW
ncbi:hypothetical protein ABFX02_14G061400 [Erythranthe guttata]